MALQKLSIVSLPVKDQQAALRFYRDVLGFEVRSDNPFMHENARWIEVAPAGGQTTLALVTWFDAMPPGSLTGLVLETDNIEAEVAGLKERGFETPPIEAQMWGRFVTFQDPDGNGWVLQQNSPPAAWTA
jgi:catechol 2,3-dioxygenase-like lactoylglutathione lyase family enzyme